MERNLGSACACTGQYFIGLVQSLRVDRDENMDKEKTSNKIYQLLARNICSFMPSLVKKSYVSQQRSFSCVAYLRNCVETGSPDTIQNAIGTKRFILSCETRSSMASLTCARVGIPGPHCSFFLYIYVVPVMSY